jgi:hypothetical protein
LAQLFGGFAVVSLPEGEPPIVGGEPCKANADLGRQDMMKLGNVTRILASGAMVAALAAPVFAADLTPQPVSRVDVTALADGYRVSKIIGAPVVNDNHDTIGKIDDLLVARQDRVLYAVLSVGGFLGVGSKLVAVPYQSLQISDKDLVLPGGSKDALKALPEFKYATR